METGGMRMLDYQSAGAEGRHWRGCRRLKGDLLCFRLPESEPI